MTDLVLIYSNHHKAWWGPNGANYYRDITSAGQYDPAETDQWMGRGCGCCEVPEILVPAPSDDVLADAGALHQWSRSARGAATRKAKREGRVNRWFKAASR
jgi:hypothetical protein